MWMFRIFFRCLQPHSLIHMLIRTFKVPAEGCGFEISQIRLGPGRIHHCMRSIGAAEKALELMAKRGFSRDAFGKPIAKLGKNVEVIAKARIEIKAMRMMILKVAKAMDVLGNADALTWISAIKAMVPIRVCQIIDEAIQIHGATGLSQWTPIAEMYRSQRTLRLADGPDEVHWFVVGPAELNRWSEEAKDYDPKQAFLSVQSRSSGESEGHAKDKVFEGP